MDVSQLSIWVKLAIGLGAIIVIWIFIMIVASIVIWLWKNGKLKQKYEWETYERIYNKTLKQYDINKSFQLKPAGSAIGILIFFIILVLGCAFVLFYFRHDVETELGIVFSLFVFVALGVLPLLFTLIYINITNTNIKIERLLPLFSVNININEIESIQVKSKELSYMLLGGYYADFGVSDAISDYLSRGHHYKLINRVKIILKNGRKLSFPTYWLPATDIEKLVYYLNNSKLKDRIQWLS